MFKKLIQRFDYLHDKLFERLINQKWYRRIFGRYFTSIYITKDNIKGSVKWCLMKGFDKKGECIARFKFQKRDKNTGQCYIFKEKNFKCLKNYSEKSYDM